MGSELKRRIQEDLTRARKARDKARTVLLTTVLSDLRNAEIERRGELSDEQAVEVLSRNVKQRREAAEQMTEAGRDELATKEEWEAEQLLEYLPAQLSEEEVREMVREAVDAGADAVGSIMGRIMPRLKGRFDGREANRIVREELEGR